MMRGRRTGRKEKSMKCNLACAVLKVKVCRWGRARATPRSTPPDMRAPLKRVHRHGPLFRRTSVVRYRVIV